VGTLLKDFLFVIPIYGVFFLLNLHELRRVRVPHVLTLLLVLFGALVFLQLFNPNLKRIVVGLVGVKVWLMYMPLVYISAAFFQRAEDLVRVLRVVVAIAAIPCGIGILQFILCATIGYEQTMTLIYRGAAAAATQEFASFYMGAEFYRIPSTFSFIAQYAGYCLLMIPIIYMMLSVEPETHWRVFARFMMGLVLVAAMLTGSRGNFLFAPLLYLTILFLDAKLTRLAAGLVFAPIVFVSTLEAAGLNVLGIFTATGGLVQQYSRDLILPELIAAVSDNPLGSGTGMNTGPAANVMSAAERASMKSIEGGGYYTKAAVELGFPGLMLVVMIFGALILNGFGVRRSLRDPMARSCSAAITAFVIIMAMHSFKGWQIDLDPINVWFWVLVGVLFQLPTLQFREVEMRRRLAEEERTHRTRRPRRGRMAPHPGAAR
jgi:hypothetical protein